MKNLGHLNSLLDLLDDLVLNARFTQDVVWGDAGLTTVGVLPPSNAPAHQEQSWQGGNSRHASLELHDADDMRAVMGGSDLQAIVKSQFLSM